MAEDISSLLLKALGGNKSARSEDSSLPDSLKKLTEAITKSMQERTDTSKKELSASEKRNQSIDGLFRQYQADLKETARIFKALNETEANSLKLAEKEAKEGAAYRKRVEAANRRAEKLNSVGDRQAGERQTNWLGLIGAIGGKGFQGVVESFVKASEQTKKDIATISDARYEDITATAAEAREDKFAAADKGLETAKQAHGQAIQNATEMEGRALQKMMAGDKTLDATENADAALKAAKANQRAVASEGTAKIKAAKEGNEEAPARGERAERGGVARDDALNVVVPPRWLLRSATLHPRSVRGPRRPPVSSWMLLQRTPSKKKRCPRLKPRLPKRIWLPMPKCPRLEMRMWRLQRRTPKAL